VNELRVAGITTVAAANRYLRERFIPAFNVEFARPPADPASAVVPLGRVGVDLDQILCVEEERVVGRDNVVVQDILRTIAHEEAVDADKVRMAHDLRVILSRHHAKALAARAILHIGSAAGRGGSFSAAATARALKPDIAVVDATIQIAAAPGLSDEGHQGVQHVRHGAGNRHSPRPRTA
jgi:hypothetical protein